MKTNQRKFEKCLDDVLSEIRNGEIGDVGEAFTVLAFKMISAFDIQGPRPYLKEIYDCIRITRNSRL